MRVQPLATKPLYVQAGRIPPVFGAFARREYGAGNPLIGLPLAYHYPTVVRPDVVPPSVDALMANRGEGWWVRYPRGASEGRQGVPLTSARRWDTGVQARWGDGPVDVAVSLTNGSLSKPLTDDDNGGKQLAARLGLRPNAAISLGASVARGEFVSDAARDALPGPAPARRYRQEAFGVDGEVSRGYILFRGELVAALDHALCQRRADARVGGVGGVAREPGEALTALVGGGPRRAAAVLQRRLRCRADVRGVERRSGIGSPEPEEWGAHSSWDAPVTRAEVAASYLLQRNVRLKAAWQYDWRDGGRVRREGHAAAQIGYWF